MNVKPLRYASALLLAILTFVGCDDNTGSLGMDMLPSADGLSAHMQQFDVVTESVKAKNVFSKTSKGYIGRFTDPEFGYYESSFLTELNCTDNYHFPVEVYKPDNEENPTKATGVMVEDKITKVNLVLYYSSWFGDSLNACRLSAYELEQKKWMEAKKEPEKIQFTDFKINRFKGDLMARKSYSAFDASVPDSVRNAVDSYGNKTFYPNVTLSLDTEKYGNRILKLNRDYQAGKNHAFDNAETFIREVLPGVLIQNDFGDGTILYIDRVDLQMQFRFYYTDSKTGLKLKKKVKDENGEIGSDSIGYGWTTAFASTKEVIQANSFSADADKKLEDKLKEKDCTYIKSPAGIFTQATLPYKQIYEELKNDTLNSVKLTFTNYHQKDDYAFSMSTPNNVLLVRKTDYEKFFTENQLPDNITSYVVAHNNQAVNQYTFSNLARLVTTCINEKNAAQQKAQEEAAEKGKTWDQAAWEKKWEKENPDWDKVWLIPVAITYDSNANGMPTSVQNDLQPRYAKLKGGPESEPLKLEVIYTRFTEQ